jgi:endonuclease YncB( thermonuclease family)
MHLAVIIAVLIVLPYSALAAPFTGMVVGITDGDTITVLTNGRHVKVRLADIDAPERAQPYGSRARQHLSALCFQRDVAVDDHGRDRSGYIIGRVTCAGKDANAEQVRSGMAWVLDKSVTDRSLYRLQDTARGHRRGLWTDQKPIPPWEWRKEGRE